MAPVKAAPKRLTREERRAATRESLIDAAGAVFAERGFHGASVEEIAERAGFTRGAFYSNFDGKDDVFLAVYDRRVDGEIGAVSALVRAAASPVELLTALRQRRSSDPVDPSWLLLHNEFWLYAMRNAHVRAKFAKRFRRIRRGYAKAIEAQYASLGVEPPAPLEDLALILQILDEGSMPLHLLDPADVRRDFFFDALALLFEASIALARSHEGAPGVRGRARPSR